MWPFTKKPKQIESDKYLEDRQLLRMAILKWDLILAGTIRNEGAYNCSLCAKYLNPPEIAEEDECQGCPVMAISGHSHCEGTPYNKFRELDDSHETVETARADPKWVAAAWAERSFLATLHTAL